MADMALDDTVAPAPFAATEAPDTSLEAALRRAARGDAATLSAHLTVLERDIPIGTTKTRLHCYFLPVDGNGRVRFKPLAEFLRDRIIDYAIPRRTIEEALRDVTERGSAVPFSKLHERARQLFTDLAQSGEGGELLLFAMAEGVFELTQLLCKMTLKTSPSMHYHGSDGVYGEGRPDGGLNLYWGESKIYADAAAAIRECLASLAPFLVQPDGADANREQDILLLNEFANLTDPRLVDGLKRFLNRDDPLSLQTRHCGIALVAFDSAAYPAADVEAIADKIAAALRNELDAWSQNVQRRIEHEKLRRFDVHFICVPVPSAEEFRRYFLQMLGAQA